MLMDYLGNNYGLFKTECLRLLDRLLSQEDLKAEEDSMAEGWSHLKAHSVTCLVPVMG